MRLHFYMMVCVCVCSAVCFVALRIEEAQSEMVNVAARSTASLSSS